MVVLTDKDALRLTWLAEALLIGVMIFAANSVLTEGDEPSLLAISLSILPFVIALCLEAWAPTSKQWRLISAFHQGGAVLWGVLGLIFMVVSFFPQNESFVDMWPFLLFCLALVGLQLCVVRLTRRFRSGSNVEGKTEVSFVRAFSVLYSAGLFLALFK